MYYGYNPPPYSTGPYYNNPPPYSAPHPPYNTIYNPGPRHYGGAPVPNPIPNPNQKNTANNNNYRNLTPLKLDNAIIQSSYPVYKREDIINCIINNFDNNKNAKVYFTSKEKEKIFIVEYILNVSFSNKSYKITLLIHIPLLYPDYPPEIYIEKKKNNGLSNEYKNGKIDAETFKVNINSFVKFDPQRDNIMEIIDGIKMNFDQNFPLYHDKNNTANNRIIFGKNSIDKSQVIEVNTQTDRIRNDAQFLTIMRRQVKDIIREKYYKFKEKYNLPKDLEDVKIIDQNTKMKTGNNNSNDNPMFQNLDELTKIRDNFLKCENDISDEIKNMGSVQKDIFARSDDIVEIKNKKYMEYIIKKKVMEDYLVYLRKGYEKKVVDLNYMIDLTRSFTREIFTLDYLMKKIEKGIE
jgi:hypothetical protein